MKIGIVGYSGQKFDTEKAIKFINNGLDHFKVSSKDELVSGYTDLGIPALGYREGIKRGMKTTGIACEKASEYEVFPVDKKIIIGKDWGDESETFLNYIDVLIKVGGGKQSITEFNKFSGLKIEYDLEAT